MFCHKFALHNASFGLEIGVDKFDTGQRMANFLSLGLENYRFDSLHILGEQLK